MGKRPDVTDKNPSKTLPSSPTHSSSPSSDFEFAVSPRKSCPAVADELFYKGQLLPLHLPPRISMVRSLLLSSSAATSHDSSSSAESFFSDISALAHGIDASRSSSSPSSVPSNDSDVIARKNYFSLSRFSSDFKKNPKLAGLNQDPLQSTSRKLSLSAKEVARKYLMKMKPFYERLRPQNQQHSSSKTTSTSSCFPNTAPFRSKTQLAVNIHQDNNGNSCSKTKMIPQLFSGNLNYPSKTGKSCVGSCPSSMRSSPTRPGAGIPSKSGFVGHYSDSSTMEELQAAIQAAIAHCKNSLR